MIDQTIPHSRRRSQLRLIETIAFIVMLSPCVRSQTAISEKPALHVAVTNITPQAADVFEIHYSLKNMGNEDLYLPYHQISGSIALTTYELLRHTNEGAWNNIGPSYDIAALKAQIVRPGATLNLVEPISNSVLGTPPGMGDAPHKPCSDTNGCYRIRIGYYSGAATWQKRLNTMREQQQTHKTLRLPRMEFAYSEPFEIPPAAK